jgi:hypothetical protein
MSFTPVSHSTLGLYEATRQSSVLDQKPSQEQFWGKEGVSFDSFLDVVNPLQQLPVVSTIYRAVTGDTISTGARLAGGALFGGPLGFASALVNTIVEAETGKDIGANVLSAVSTEGTAGALAASTSLAGQKTEINANDRAAYLAYSKAVRLE